jgi:hypothetical protein
MAELVEVWPRAVGDAISRNAWPARLGSGGVLHVAVSSSAWAFELTQLEGELLGRLRDALGETAPARLKFAPGPLPEPAVEHEPQEQSAVAVPSPAAVSEAARIARPIEDEKLRKLVARAAAASLAKAESDRRFW